MTKRCSRCREVKDRSEFSRNRTTKDGLQYQCKVCQVESKKASGRRHPEAARVRVRRYGAHHPDRVRERANAYKAANPEKAAAHHAVAHAIERGEMARPVACTQCGETRFRIDGHHPDYSRPLDVEWLCVPCHRTAHQEIARERAVHAS